MKIDKKEPRTLVVSGHSEYSGDSGWPLTNVRGSFSKRYFFVWNLSITA